MDAQGAGWRGSVLKVGAGQCFSAGSGRGAKTPGYPIIHFILFDLSVIIIVFS
ncbi:hypothetical protein JCM15764A_08480 [Geotalea toluenoxydans]